MYLGIAWLQLASILAGGCFAAGSAFAAGCLIAPGVSLPRAVRFTTGGTALSLCIFLLLAVNAGYAGVFVGLGLGLMGAAGWLRVTRQTAPDTAFPALPRGVHWFFLAVFGIAAVFYLIYAVAPDTQPDSARYHLADVVGYLRTHSLSRHISFYELLPQGPEMLYSLAFAIGAHSAAKLVHFAFLVSVVPLVRAMGAEAGVSPTGSAAAGLLMFLSPVAAIAGTSAYTDLALVACCCSVFYLLVRWRREPSPVLLLMAGLNAGFCYSVKPTFGHVAIAGLIYVAWFAAPRGRAVLTFLGAAALPTLPWLVRAWLLSGNPFAPLLNAFFPHDGLDAANDTFLFHFFGVLNPDFRWRTMLLDYSFLGGNQGLLGMAFVLLPLGLLALRTKGGRRLVAYSALLALPVITNTGSRFVLPATAPLALAMTSVLPGPAAIALVAIQGVAAIRPVVQLYNKRDYWELPELPLNAALRIEPETDYLHRVVLRDSWTNDIIHNSTPPGAKVLSLDNVADGYLDRYVLGYWTSEQGSAMRSALDVGMLGPLACMSSTFAWPAGQYRELRLTASTAEAPIEWQVLPGDTQLSWQGILKKDTPTEMALPPGSSGAVILSVGALTPKVEGLTEGGRWQTLTTSIPPTTAPRDIRRDTTAFMARQGFRYLLVANAASPFAKMGTAMTADPEGWGVKRLNYHGDVGLFRVETPASK